MGIYLHEHMLYALIEWRSVHWVANNELINRPSVLTTPTPLVQKSELYYLHCFRDSQQHLLNSNCQQAKLSESEWEIHPLIRLL